MKSLVHLALTNYGDQDRVGSGRRRVPVDTTARSTRRQRTPTRDEIQEAWHIGDL